MTAFVILLSVRGYEGGNVHMDCEGKTKTEKSDTNLDPGSDDDITPGNYMEPEVIAPVVVCVALTLIVVLVLVLCRHKLPRAQGCCATGGASEQRTNAQHYTEENHGNHHYEEIQMQNQQASSGVALPSIYAIANPPADQLHYASVNFQKDSVSVLTDKNALSDMNETVSSACDYSITRSQGATYPAAAEQTLYSAVTKPGEA